MHRFAARCGLIAALCACSGDEESETIVEVPPPAACGSIALPDGTCIDPGVPADGCAPGFEHSGDGGCEAVLPVERCVSGMLAVPGDTRCRQVASCGREPWGDIPLEPDTQFVDQSYSGTLSDGSIDSPWTRIQDAITAASPGGMVAIAAGSYIEDLSIENKSLRLWGRCPELVEVVGTGTANPALFITRFASGTEVHRLALRSPGFGLIVSGSEGVLLQELWLHDTDGGAALEVAGAYGPTSVELSDSLIEGSLSEAAFALGARLVVERTHVRSTREGPDGMGRGVVAQVDPLGARGALEIRASLVEDNVGLSITAFASDLLVETTAVRDSLMTASGTFGRAVNVQDFNGSPSRATVRDSVFSDSTEFGVYAAGSEIVVERTTVRRTGIDGADILGHGIHVIDAGLRSNLRLVDSLVSEGHTSNVLIAASDATLEGIIVRDTHSAADGRFGRAMSLQNNPDTGQRGNVAVSRSLFERNIEIGLFMEGSDVTVDSSVVRDTSVRPDGTFGRGINIIYDIDSNERANVTLTNVLVERSQSGGVFVMGSDAAFHGVHVKGSLSDARGEFGDGVIVMHGNHSAIPANVSLTGARIESSARAGISSFGAVVTLESTTLACQSFDIASELYMSNPASVEDRGNNRCGCPEATESCKSVSAALAPPLPLSD